MPEQSPKRQRRVNKQSPKCDKILRGSAHARLTNNSGCYVYLQSLNFNEMEVTMSSQEWQTLYRAIVQAVQGAA